MRDDIRPMRRWKDNIKVDLGKIGFGNVNLIYQTQDSVQ
jgi:hypothetical protein